MSEEGFADTITSEMDARGALLARAMTAAITDLPATSVLDVGWQVQAYACALLEYRPSPGPRSGAPAGRRSRLAPAGCPRASRWSAGKWSWPSLTATTLACFPLHARQGRARRPPAPQALRRRLASGGWVVDHDAHVSRDKTGPLPVARDSVLLMHTTAGKCWSVAELEAMMEQVGFGEVDETTGRP